VAATVLGLQVTGHGEVVVLPHLVVVGVHPVDRPLPVAAASSTDHSAREFHS